MRGPLTLKDFSAGEGIFRKDFFANEEIFRKDLFTDRHVPGD